MPRLLLTGGAWAAIALLAIQSVARAESAPQSWEQTGPNQWREVEPAPAAVSGPTARPDPELARIAELNDRRQFKDARKAAVHWLIANPNSPQRDQGLMLVADALYGIGNRIRAFYYLDELLDTYPDSPLYQPALEKQYAIADAYLRGYRRRLLWLPILGAEEEAIEMLFRIQQRAPGSVLAERALLRTADYYYANQDYDFAVDAYAAYVRDYPRSPVTPKVRLRRAYSSLAQFRGPRFDATPLIDAREQLREIIANYPELAASENVSGVLERIDRGLARKLYTTADFYRRTGEPEAAVYAYRYLAMAYPNTSVASRGRERLQGMPPHALDTPFPQSVGSDGPTSEDLDTSSTASPTPREGSR